MTSTPFGSELIVPQSDSPLANTERARIAQTGWFAPTTLSIAALSLGLALQVNFGQYHPAAMPRLALALIACVAAAVLPNFGIAKIANWRPDQLVLAVALAVQFAMLWSTNPVATMKIATPDDLAPFKAGVALAAALVAVSVSGTRLARFAVPAMLLTYLVLGAWVIYSTPAPGIDVYVFQRDASDALIHGTNPYAITFPDIYHGKLPVYGPGISQNGRLQFGYPYLPLTLLMAVPGHLLGDFRYAQLAAMTLAGLLIAHARPCERSVPGARSVAAAALLLFTPRGFFVLEAGWTEPFSILLLAMTVFAACRRGVWWGIACTVSFGLLLASKQYVVLALPLILLLMSTPALRARGIWMLAIALVVAAAVSLPLALWDIGAFMRSAVVLQFHQPVRPDALSFLARGANWPAWTPFAFAGAAVLLALWRCPRTPAGFATAFAMVFFAFFATNKQAFCNYYALVLAALCCALAATPGCVLSKPRKP